MTDHLHDRLVAAVGEHYLIEAELGRGGMAAVFRALDLRLNRRVAIKVLPPELAFNPSVRSRFLREAQMAAQLTHPNIVPIFAVDETDGLVYFVMAYVDGESLAARLRREGSLRVEDVCTIVSQVADGLDYAHRQGLVHRDVKPDNILLDRSTGSARVTDFGIARAAAEESRLTVTGMSVGTPAYMSPEQAMGERELDGRSDIYSLGIVAYQMLAGETPFRAANTPSMLMKHVSEPPPPLRGRRADVPSAVATTIERALAKRPEDRWRSAADMRDALKGRALERDDHAPVSPQPPAPLPMLREAPPPAALAPMFAVPPAGLSRRERKDYYREQRHAFKSAVRLEHGSPASDDKAWTRISKFRRNLIGYPAVSLMLLGINAATGGFPWFIFPTMGLSLALVLQAGWLWGEGVTVKEVFGGRARKKSTESRAAPVLQDARDAAEALVTREVLEGPHGEAIRRAVSARAIIVDILSRMTKKEREMLPADLESTVAALVDRVTSVATTLHRLDSDASGGHLGSLDQRIADLKRNGVSPETQRRIAMLERQRTTLRDLLERRNALLTQLESASLALENLKLDLVRFRSAGVSSALEDVTSATQEARAVSRDLGHLLDAQDEMRKL
ncbi:MAG: serine/threonine-protein kinase [Gemmatimonadaceae bacterium]